MPQLPTQENLGERPVPAVVPALAPIQGGHVPGAIEGMGEAIGKISSELNAARRATDLTNALTAATEELGQEEITMRRDQDFATMPDRFRAAAKDIGQKYSAGITDDVSRRVFQSRFSELTTSRQLDVAVSAAKQESDNNKGTLLTGLETLVQSYASAGTPAGREVAANEAFLRIENNRSHGWITDVEAAHYKITFMEHGEKAVVMRDIINDAAGTLARLTGDPEYGKLLNPVDKERLTRSAIVAKDHQAAQLKQQEKEVQEKEGQRLFDLFGQNKLNVQTIMAANLPYTQKLHFESILHTRAKEMSEDRPAKTVPSVYDNVRKRVNADWSDPDKITGSQQIWDFYGKGLSRSDAEVLDKQREQAKSPDGQTEAKYKEGFFRGLKAKITHSNPMQGRLDNEGDAKFLEFQREVESQMAQRRAAGKDPRDLLNPDKPEYMGNPKALLPFQKSTQESAATVSQSMTRKATGADARKPGESYHDYRRRVPLPPIPGRPLPFEGQGGPE